MKFKWSYIVAGVFVLVLLTTVSYALVRAGAPSGTYQGKPEAYWMRALAGGQGTRELAQLCTNYTTLCLIAVAKRENPIQTAYLRLWPSLPAVFKPRLPLPINIQEARTNAARVLATTGDAKILIPLLNNFDPVVRDYATRGLIFAGGAEVTLALAKALDDQDAYSDGCRTPIRIHIGQSFQFKADTCSD